MKVTKFPKKLKRKYLRLASVYRRYAARSKFYDFSLQALLECYEHESKGTPASPTNGYLYGKWCKDISVVTWREDIAKGDFCKAEFTMGIDGWWATKALETVIVEAPWFPFDECTYSSKDELRKSLEEVKLYFEQQNEDPT